MSSKDDYGHQSHSENATPKNFLSILAVVSGSEASESAAPHPGTEVPYGRNPLDIADVVTGNAIPSDRNALANTMV